MPCPAGTDNTKYLLLVDDKRLNFSAGHAPSSASIHAIKKVRLKRTDIICDEVLLAAYGLRFFKTRTNSASVTRFVTFVSLRFSRSQINKPSPVVKNISIGDIFCLQLATEVAPSGASIHAIKKVRLKRTFLMAEVTRLELATSCVTGRRSNQLSYTSITRYLITNKKNKSKYFFSSCYIFFSNCVL